MRQKDEEEVEKLYEQLQRYVDVQYELFLKM
jgi:hypothetical protein